MKLSRDEKQAVISALSYAIAANEKWQIDSWRFKNLRKKWKITFSVEGDTRDLLAGVQRVMRGPPSRVSTILNAIGDEVDREVFRLYTPAAVDRLMARLARGRGAQ